MSRESSVALFYLKSAYYCIAFFLFIMITSEEKKTEGDGDGKSLCSMQLLREKPILDLTAPSKRQRPVLAAT
jgi:hypothetical protein